MDMKQQLEEIEKMQTELISTYSTFRDGDEKFLRTVISYFHLNMTEEDEPDTAKIKADSIDETDTIIGYMDLLYDTNQIYYDFIQTLYKRLEEKS
ncbi:MAG: hypothetical protein NTW78_05855 [Campylobacterales bacterium]|nr:hypothetical protein [Campylobacterales bacterium]